MKIKKYIKVDLSFLIVLILSLFTSNIFTFLLSIIIILCHEFCHLIVSLIFNVKPKSITITAVGGIIDIPLYKLSPIKKIFVSISGIIFNICIIFILIKHKNYQYYEFLLEYNISLIIFSLLPIYPLDGYNIFHGIFEQVFKDDVSKGFMISRNLSIFVLIVLTIFSIYQKNIGLIVIIIFLIYKNIQLFKRKDFIFLQRYQYYLK